MVSNNGMYFNYGNSFNGYNNYPGGCCMQCGYAPHNPLNANYQRYNQSSYTSWPYTMSNIQYAPTVPSFSASGTYSVAEDEEYSGYINPSQLKMRTVSIKEVVE